MLSVGSSLTLFSCCSAFLPLLTGQVLVGPVSPRLPQPLEAQKAAAPEVFDFLQTTPADAGVVLVGFGSTGVFGNTMTPEDFIELAAGFSSLAPTRVLWPMSKTNLPDNLTLKELPLSENVKIVSWVDYNDVLGHPSVKVFMTHCGVHSMMEAAFHGVAVVGMPFQFEQKENCGKLVSAGMGEMATQAVAFRAKDPSIRFTREYVSDIIEKVRSPLVLQQCLVHVGFWKLHTFCADSILLFIPVHRVQHLSYAECNKCPAHLSLYAAASTPGQSVFSKMMVKTVWLSGDCVTPH